MSSNAGAALALSSKHSLVGIERIITIGSRVSISSISPTREFAVVFEDDSESAHFYAVNASRDDRQILDLVNIYTVGEQFESKTSCVVRIGWSEDAWKAILAIDGYPHAVFDFRERRGYCRTNYPNVPQDEMAAWHSEDHGWQDAVMQWFG